MHSSGDVAELPDGSASDALPRTWEESPPATAAPPLSDQPGAPLSKSPPGARK
jgi:hypothetical protein